jgi:hypothetical protein
VSERQWSGIAAVKLGERQTKEVEQAVCSERCISGLGAEDEVLFEIFEFAHRPKQVPDFTRFSEH